MITLSHPTGNQFVRALLDGLQSAGVLNAFFTTLSTRAGRRYYDLPRTKIRTRPQRESVRLIAQRLGWNAFTTHETGWASTDAVYQDLDRAVARWIQTPAGKSDVYAYEDGALETFRAAKQLGLKTCYELPIAYWETCHRLLQEEAERFPEWEPTLFSTRDSEGKFQRKTEEISLADRIICPSQFVWDSLPAAARDKCTIAEFGSPLPRPLQPRPTGQCLRLLFAGTLSQRKGLADLFAAMHLLNRSDVELVIMGSLVAPMSFYRNHFAGFTYEPPRSHSAVLDLMSTCDLLVLPSIVEGRALVQQEALSSGLPLLVTANAGGADLITEGQTGFLVPIRAPAAIAEKIAWFADHRSQLSMMRKASQDKAAEYTWKKYSEKILREII